MTPMKNRSQFKTRSGHYAKRDKKSGRIMNVKADADPLERVRKER
jgi:hypothetical protein